MSHSHDGLASHSHDSTQEHGHSHEILDGPGSYLGREMPLIEGRDWNERAFTVGIGGYVPHHTTTQTHLLDHTLLTRPRTNNFPHADQ